MKNRHKLQPDKNSVQRPEHFPTCFMLTVYFYYESINIIKMDNKMSFNRK